MRRRHRILACVWCLALAFSLWSFGHGMTGARYVDTATGSFSAVASYDPIPPADCFHLCVGRSRATYVTRPRPFPRIARVSPEGELYLDFGEIRPDNQNNSPQVLVVSNDSTSGLLLECTLSPEIAPLFSVARVDPSALPPGRSADLEMKLAPPADADPGEYRGTLTITDSLTGHAETLPVSVVILPEEGCREVSGSADAPADDADGSTGTGAVVPPESGWQDPAADAPSVSVAPTASPSAESEP